MLGSGDGWTTCGLGHRHWGLYGGAGLLLRTGPEPAADLLMQLRSAWSHHGGTWGIPGGARDDGESAVAGALRESNEEAGIEPGDVEVQATFVDDHGGWTYTTALATARRALDPHPVGTESDAVRWVRLNELDRLPLHHGFAHSWPQVRAIAASPVIVVDAANTVGSRPDGWWRDRAGAAERLRDELAQGLAAGLPDAVLAGWQQRPADDAVRRFPTLIMVVEGAARDVTGRDAVRVVSAPASGDDTIVAVVTRQAAGPRTVIVVTADRELRRRVEAVGATVIGPRVLLDLL